MLVVVSKAKKIVKEKADASLGVEACEELSKIIEKLLLKAAEKAKADKRKVIKPRDLIEDGSGN